MSEDDFTMDSGLCCTCENCCNAIVNACDQCGSMIVYCEYWGEFIHDPDTIKTEETCEGIVPMS